MGIVIKRIDGPQKGQVYVERDDIAQNLIDVGSAIEVSPELLERAMAQPVETPEIVGLNTDALKKSTVTELRAEAKRRKVKVKGTGNNKKVTKADLVKALS